MSKKTKRLRMFAGPNGSGKSTMFEDVKKQFNIGFYVNADDIQRQLQTENFISLKDYNITSNKLDFQDFLNSSTLLQKAEKSGSLLKLEFKNNQLINHSKNSFSYEAALIAAFIREQLLKGMNTFSFETVMSHSSKIEVLKEAKSHNFKTYLYFISTKSVSINIQRVENRVVKGGHPVPKNKIESRYYQSLALLPKAIPYTDRTYIFDNSRNHYRLILEIFQGKEIIVHQNSIPRWIENYLLNQLL